MKYWCFIAVFVVSCGTYNKSRKPTDFSSNYRKDKTGFSVKYLIFNHQDQASRVYFMVNSQELLHTRASSGDQFYYHLEFRYRLYSDAQKKVIADSSRVVIHKKSDPYKNMEIRGYFDIQSNSGKSYILEITAEDIYRNIAFTQYLNLDRTGKGEVNNFLVLKHGRIAFDPYVYVGDTIQLRSRYRDKNYFIRHLYKNFLPAPPPFTYIEETNYGFEMDSLFQTSSNDTLIELILKHPGIYFIRQDTSTLDGFSVLCFDRENFPKITNQQKLSPPLRYITSKREYMDLDVKDPKMPFEQFWLNITGNNYDRSRILIREYYQRVNVCNELFTSYMEGWKTDRGMIYIVFGVPDAVYRSVDGENWIYGADNSVLSVTFAFSKINNPLTGNDYILNRSNVYRSMYYKAVDYWRQGKIEVLN